MTEKSQWPLLYRGVEYSQVRSGEKALEAQIDGVDQSTFVSETSSTDTVEIQSEQLQSSSGGANQQQKPWWDPVNLLKQAGTIGLNIGALVAGGAIGFMLGGPPGALIGASIAGAGMSGVTSALDQQVSNGKIDWGQVGIETVIGGIPMGGVGNAAVKGLGKLGFGILKEGTEGIAAQLLKGSINGATEGAILGSAQGAATSIYQQGKEGQIDLNQLTQDTLSGTFGGALGGGVLGGAMHTVVNKFGGRTTLKERLRMGEREPYPPPNGTNPHPLFKPIIEIINSENPQRLNQLFDSLVKPDNGLSPSLVEAIQENRQKLSQTVTSENFIKGDKTTKMRMLLEASGISTGKAAQILSSDQSVPLQTRQFLSAMRSKCSPTRTLEGSQHFIMKFMEIKNI